MTVKSFRTPIEAHLARSVLENEGIEAFVRDEYSIGLRPYLSPSMGGVRLDVPEEDLERARALLDVPPAAADPKLCPECGGEAAPVTDPTGYFAAILSTLFIMVPSYPLRQRFRCGKCGHEWRR